MPPSSYPPANGFRPGAPPGAAPGAAPHPAGQHIQAVSPHGQGLSSPFHGGDLSLQHPTQHPFAAQQHTQQHSQQYSQHHASIGTYGPAVNQQQQQQSSAAHSDAHFSPYGHQGPPVRPPGPSAGPQAQQHAATGYAHQAQGFGQQQGQSYSVPTGQIHMQPDYGPQRQPELERGVPAMGGLAQQGGAGSQQGMSHQEMAQQAERKRRFTEQKRENQLQQVMLFLRLAGSLCMGEMQACLAWGLIGEYQGTVKKIPACIYAPNGKKPFCMLAGCFAK